MALTYAGHERQSSSRGSPAPGTSAILRPGRAATESVRASGAANPAPMDARTALGEYGSAVPGPSATHEAPNASAERSTAPTLPGSCTPCRYTHSGPTGAGAQRSSYTASVGVPEPRPEAEANTPGSTSIPTKPLPAAAYRSMGIQPLASAELNKSSPSATNCPARSRQRRRWRSLRISLSLSLWGLVIIKKGALLKERRPVGGAGWSACRSAGRQRLTGAVGKASEGVAVTHGDVREDLAVELHPGQLEAMHELRVGHVVLARGGVDARDPEPAEVALAVAPVPVAVLIGLEHGLLGRAVMAACVTAIALGHRQRGAALLAGVNRALDAGHPRCLRLTPSRV